MLLSIFSKIDPSKGYKGITCFIATKDMGIQIAKKEQKLGIRASSTCTLNFDDLKVPAENVIGGEGLGYKIAIEILNEGPASSPVSLPHLLRQLNRSHWYRCSDGWPCPRSI
jgi:alkylation response protein AidB-like acyl-CoA dehydrogenase